jgi:hypothetical protein
MKSRGLFSSYDSRLLDQLSLLYSIREGGVTHQKEGWGEGYGVGL